VNTPVHYARCTNVSLETFAVQHQFSSVFLQVVCVAFQVILPFKLELVTQNIFTYLQLFFAWNWSTMTFLSEFATVCGNCIYHVCHYMNLHSNYLSVMWTSEPLWRAVWGWARVWASVWLADGVVWMELCICMFLYGCLCIFITLIFPMFFFPCGICPSLLLPSLSWSSCLQYYAVYSSICFFVFCCVFIILCANWVHEISVNSKIIVCCKWKITSFSVNFSILWQWMLQLWCVGVWHHVG